MAASPTSSHRTRRPFAVAVVVASAALAACGGGSSTSDNQGGTDAFLDEAEVVCKKAASDIAGLRSPDDLAGFADYVNDGAGVLDDAVAELDDLTPPEALADDWDNLVDELNVAVRDAEAIADTASDGDRQAVVDAVTAYNELIDGDVADAAADAGADRCAFNIIAVIVPQDSATPPSDPIDETTTTTGSDTIGDKVLTEAPLTPAGDYTYSQENDDFKQAWINNLNNSSPEMAALAGIAGAVGINEADGTISCSLAWFFPSSADLPDGLIDDTVQFFAGSETPVVATAGIANGYEFAGDSGTRIFYGSLAATVIWVQARDSAGLNLCVERYLESF